MAVGTSMPMMLGIVWLTRWMGARFAALVGLLCTPEYLLDVLLVS